MTTIGVAEERALLTTMQNSMDRINGKVATLRGNINSKVRWLPAHLAKSIILGWNHFLSKLQELFNLLKEFLGKMGTPVGLWSTADEWSKKVGSPVSGQTQTAEPGLLEVDDNWQGRAADKYRQMLPLQHKALTAMKTTLADGISEALSNLAVGVIAFWVGLIIALGAFIGGLIGAIFATGSIAGLPAGPVIAAGAAVAAVLSLLAGTMTLRAVASSQNSALVRKLADNTAYRNGHWPPATTT